MKDVMSNMKSRYKPARRTLTGVILLLISATFLSTYLGGCAKQQAAGFKAPPTAVEMAVATTGTVADKFEAVGTIEANNAITVVSQIDALVIDLPFREGEPVEKGGLIAQLDDSQLRAEETRASALRDQKKISYDRVKSIVDQGAGAPQDLDNAAAELKIAEADLDLIRARLDKTRIVAPFSGILGARRISPGAFLRAGMSITDLADLDRLKITFSAPERYYPDLTKGAEITVSTTAFPNYELKGQIDVIEPVVDQSTRSAHIIAHLDNPGRKFRPGMSANVSAVLSQRNNALTIPDEAIFAEGDQAFVYGIKDDSTVTRIPVTIGTRLRGSVEITKGLEVGSKVVRAGYQKLYEGAKVMPVMSQLAVKPDSSTGVGK